MSVFSISLSDKQYSVENDLCASGEITIGDFSEKFHASLSYWTHQDYVRQWLSALNKITTFENNKGAIISSMYNPISANFICCWVMYRLGGLVYLQNHILFLDDLSTPFDERNIEKSIPDREQVTEEGERISEWRIPLSDIQRSIELLNLN